MALPFLAQLAIGIGMQIVGYLLMPKPKPQKPPALEDFEYPTTETGRSRPVPFGSVLIKSPNLLSKHDKQRNSRKT